ncbi:MAG: trypsin-like peptidase domain-containing protein [Gemmataceae bacterium]
MSYDDRTPWPPPARRGPAPTSPFGPVLTLLLAIAVVVGGLFAYRGWQRFADTGRDADAQSRPVTPRGDLTDLEKTNIRIYKQSRDSVAHIFTRAVRSDFFRAPVEVPAGTRSGFVWDEQGHVITNYHVVKNSSSVKVMFFDQTTYNARVVGGAEEKDLAVLFVEAPREKLKPLLVGSSDDLQVGQMVYAIGNPFGFDQTLTTGIISALGRELGTESESTTLKNMIQTDAAINPGNSGGPLLDSAGRLIGINTAIYTRTGSYAGIGFAIPVDEVNRVVPQLIRHGKVIRPSLQAQLANDRLARSLGVRQGALVIRPFPGGAAERAGLKRSYRDADGQVVLGDVIVAVEKKPVKKVGDLFEHLERHQVGNTVSLTVVRDDETVEVKVTLGAGD